eukprot:scaffold31500_cov55-Attheya_sp.AAC.1
MDRDNERYSIMSYWLEGTQLIQSWLPGIGNAGESARIAYSGRLSCYKAHALLLPVLLPTACVV